MTNELEQTNNCMFRQGGYDYDSLRAGASYTLQWNQNSNGVVRIQFYEDDWRGADYCGRLGGEGSTVQGQAGMNSLDFTMPDLCDEDAGYCQTHSPSNACGLGTFPEFYIKIEYNGWGSIIDVLQICAALGVAAEADIRQCWGAGCESLHGLATPTSFLPLSRSPSGSTAAQLFA